MEPGRPTRDDAIGQDHATILERLAMDDWGERATAGSVHPLTDAEEPEPRSACLLRLGALVAIGGSQASFQRLIADITIAGLSSKEILDAMVQLASVVGRARVAAAAPKMALALGHDVGPARPDPAHSSAG